MDKFSPDWVRPRSATEARPRPVTWLVDEYIPADTITLISSVSGSGKSTIALHLALCISAGRDWLGLNTKQATYAYWDQDNPDRWLTDNRICALRRGLNLEAIPPGHIFRTSGRVLGNDKRVNELIRWLQSLGASVLIVDTLASINYAPENDNTEMNRVIVDNFTPMVEAGIAPILLHHIGKDIVDNRGQQHRRRGAHAARGGSAIAAAIGASYNLDRVGEARILEVAKPRYGSPPALRLTYDEDGYMGSDDWQITMSTGESRVTADSVTHLILEQKWHGHSSRKIVELLKDRGLSATQSTVARCLKRVKPIYR